MASLLSVSCGVLIAVMVLINGRLSAAIGIPAAVAVIHAAGLVIAILPLVLRRENPFRRNGTPLGYYAGGLIGVLTTLFNTLAFGRISLSTIIALSLLGQVLTSLAVDQFGLFGFPRRRIHAGMIAGILAVGCGILAMLRDMRADALLPALLSLATGATVVGSRIVNARLAERTTPRVGIFHNFLTGFAASLILLLALGGSGTPTAMPVPGDVWMLSGSLLGFLVILLSNWTTPRLPAFLSTLFVFVGQVFAGLALDTLISGRFTVEQCIGGGLVIAGLVLTVLKPASASGYDARETVSRPSSVPQKETRS